MRFPLTHVLAVFLFAGTVLAVDHSAFTEVLEAHVHSDGTVSYAALKESRAGLDSYIQALEAVSEADFKAWSEEDQIACLINAYNAKTLQVIIDHYPIKEHWKAKLLKFPIGIRHIHGAWDSFPMTVGGRSLSLSDIEHEVLRKEFNEPRIHMALVCASIGCPDLRQEAYTGDRLNQQLEEQTRQFLSSPAKGLRIDANTDTVWVSAIFKWFSSDFRRAGNLSSRLDAYGKTHQAILSFILPYLPEKEANLLASRVFKVDYLAYDWELNGHTARSPR